ncbi:hypothetical protein KP509_33G027700 [Ceratopteris richardii]|nr:hypothetical protein KP509_33G027700 [Ceratopteris richardii]
MITTNISVILNALHHSTMVEVHQDRIHRDNDGGKCRLQLGQSSVVLSVEDNISLQKFL